MTVTIRIRKNSRESDERLLDWLSLRDAGWSDQQIAARYGIAYQNVSRFFREFDKELTSPLDGTKTPD